MTGKRENGDKVSLTLDLKTLLSFLVGASVIVGGVTGVDSLKSPPAAAPIAEVTAKEVTDMKIRQERIDVRLERVEKDVSAIADKTEGIQRDSAATRSTVEAMRRDSRND